MKRLFGSRVCRGECTKLLSEIPAEFESANVAPVASGTHPLEGRCRLFTALAVVQPAEKVEMTGREHWLDSRIIPLVELNRQAQLLSATLNEFIEGQY